MANFFPPMRAGAPLDSITGEGYHGAIRETVKWAHAARNRAGLGAMRPGLDDKNLVWIKNTTGVTQNAYSVLGVGTTPPVTPTDNLVAFQRGRVLSGVEPSFPDHDGKFVVLLEPLANNAIGVGQIGGTCVVQVEVTSGLEWYDHADITDADTTKLTLLPSGGAQVLWIESGTGTKWARVRLGNPPGDVTYMGKTLDILPVTGAEATCYLYLDWDDYYYNEAVVETVEAGVSKSMGSVSLAVGKWVTLTWLRRYRHWIAAGAC